jgi:hypothetical protein
LADFESEYYLANGGSKTFANAITHSRLGQATMTDGYGPELVVNGSFTNDISGWTADDATISWDGGRLKTTVTGSTTGSAYQAISVEAGKAYVITGFIKVLSSSETSNITLRTGTDAGAGFLYQAGLQAGIGTEQVNGIYESDQTRTVYIHLRTFEGDNTTTLFDNVSVREMPVIKWAPHNLLTYSEDFSHSDWTKTNTTVTSNAAVAPDGTTTADEFTHTTNAASLNRYVAAHAGDGVKQTLRIYLKYVDAQWFYAFTDVAYVWVDLMNGVLGTDQSEGATLTAVGNDWYLLEVQQTQSGGAYYLQIGIATNDLQTVEEVGTSCYIWGAHLYRSDLGGMVNNPDRGDSYVPTTSSAVYLPRRGHHVYNGYEWVNEGVLHESEARTNLNFDQNLAAWIKNNNVTSVLSSEISPDGNVNAYDVSDTGSGDDFLARNISIPTTNTSYVSSVFVKKTTADSHYLNIANYIYGGTGQYFHATFNSNTGVFTAGSGISLASDTFVEDCGNYWRIAFKTTNTGSNTNLQLRLYPAYNTNGSTTRDGPVTGTKVLYGAQVESGSTPSSYIPTNGATVTRAAESLTIPSANLPWPTPQYIGDELVTASYATASPYDNITTIISASAFSATKVSSDVRVYLDVPTTVGNIYTVTYTKTSGGSTVYARAGTAGSGTIIDTDGSGVGSLTFVATTTTTSILWASTIEYAYQDISVREINPLSVSIQMRGLMTYADTGGLEAINWRWYVSSSNVLGAYFYTAGAETGELNIFHTANGIVDQVISSATHYAPDINVPYNIASRHGSTFVNVALEGVARTANTTPVALPDLSSTDLELGHNYMGTISEFRIWDKDIGDASLETATAPSLEPSLSLTFDATQSSFVDTGWSE